MDLDHRNPARNFDEMERAMAVMGAGFAAAQRVQPLDQRAAVRVGDREPVVRPPPQ